MSSRARRCAGVGELYNTNHPAQDFTRKRERGSAQGNHKPWSFFDLVNHWGNTTCMQAQQYVQGLREQQPFDLNAWFEDVAVRVGASVNDALDQVGARRLLRKLLT